MPAWAGVAPVVAGAVCDGGGAGGKFWAAAENPAEHAAQQASERTNPPEERNRNIANEDNK